MPQPSAGRRPWRRLRSLARQIRRAPRRTLADLVVVGRLLTEAKSLVRRGDWLEWLADNTSIRKSLASHAMQAAKEWGHLPISTLRKFTPSAVRILANRTIPRKLREKALLAPVSDPRKIIGPSDAILRTLEPDEGLQLAAGLLSGRLAEPPSDVPPSAAEEAYRRLTKLLTSASMVHFTVSRDPDAPDGIESVGVTMYGDDGRPMHVSRRDVDELLRAAAGEEALKRCPRCGESKPADAFARSSNSCRICERARVKAATTGKQRAKNRAKAKGL